MRGKVLLRFLLFPLRWITPAGAGKRMPGRLLSWMRRDHPRRCGEKHSLRCDANPRIGSPPQVRGKEVQKLRGYPRSRITPAGAGKSSVFPIHIFSAKDHPRRCGEKSAVKRPAPMNLGSPPQVRGKVIYSILATDDERITPAGAGKRCQ